MAEVQDVAGSPVQDGVAHPTFSVVEKGELAAVGNANPHKMASYRQPCRRTFHGRALAILHPTDGEAPSRSRRKETTFAQEQSRLVYLGKLPNFPLSGGFR